MRLRSPFMRWFLLHCVVVIALATGALVGFYCNPILFIPEEQEVIIILEEPTNVNEGKNSYLNKFRLNSDIKLDLNIKLKIINSVNDAEFSLKWWLQHNGEALELAMRIREKKSLSLFSIAPFYFYQTFDKKWIAVLDSDEAGPYWLAFDDTGKLVKAGYQIPAPERDFAAPEATESVRYNISNTCILLLISDPYALNFLAYKGSINLPRGGNWTSREHAWDFEQRWITKKPLEDQIHTLIRVSIIKNGALAFFDKEIYVDTAN